MVAKQNLSQLISFVFCNTSVKFLNSVRSLIHWKCLLLSLLTLFVSLTSISVRAQCKLKQLEIPVHIVNQRPIATLTLNGVKVSMLVDSGAFFSFLTPSTASQLNLPLSKLPSELLIQGYTGRVEAKLTRVAKIGIGGVELNNFEFIVGGNELGSGIQGLLGRNILSLADTEYDLAHGVIRIVIPNDDCKENNFAYWSGDAPVVITPLENGYNRSDTTVRIKVKINGRRDQAVLDTGAPFTAITLRAARRSEIEEKDLTPDGRAGGAGEGFERSWTARINQIAFEGEKINHVRLRVDDVEQDDGMLVGLDYFLSHRIYVSRLQKRVYITWNGSPIFETADASPGQYNLQYAAIPKAIENDNASALARRGSAALAGKKYEAALEDLNQACSLAPGVAEYRYLRAQVHVAMAQTTLAITDLDETLNLNPDHQEARGLRASIYTFLDNKIAAQTDFMLLDQTLPPTSHLRLSMANSHAQFNQYPEALKQFDLWIKNHPKDIQLADALNSRCWMRTRLNIDIPLAIEDCENAVNKDRDNASYYDSLGWAYLRSNDAEQAKKTFNKALKLETLAYSMYGRGLAKRQLNDKTGADKDLDEARKKEPKIDEKLQAEGLLFNANR